MRPKALKNFKIKTPRFYRSTKPGSAPGTIAPISQAHPTKISYITYDEDDLTEAEISRDQLEKVDRKKVLWINVSGLADGESIETLGKMFDLHPLALEDVVNVHQRPKCEDYGNTLFFIVRPFTSTIEAGTEQIALFLGPDFVISFQERPDDCFEAVRERLRTSRGRIRTSSADYLTYALVDAAIDTFYPHFETVADHIEGIESAFDSRKIARHLKKLHELNRKLSTIRKTLRPHREAMATTMKSESDLINSETKVFLRDCYDHLAQLQDMNDSYRDVCGSLREYYLSFNAHKMNEVMKVLTMISTIFIPLSFIAGLYGMNFNTSHPMNMPELNHPHGYPIVVGIMLFVSVCFVFFFIQKGWIGRRDQDL